MHVPPFDLKQQRLVVHGCLVRLLIFDVAVVLLQCVLLHLRRMADPISGASMLLIRVRDDTKVAVNIRDKCVGVCDIMY